MGKASDREKPNFSDYYVFTERIKKYITYSNEEKFPQCVIFDLDGVLLDTEYLMLECWQKAFAQFGLEISVNDALSFRSLGEEEMEKLCAERFSEKLDVEKIYELRREIMNERIEKEGVKLKPGVEYILDLLDGNKIQKAVASSASRSRAERLMKMTGIYGRFDKMTCRNNVAYGKPAPDVYLSVTGYLELDPGRCIAVEDSPNGVRSALAAKIPTVLVPDLSYPESDTRDKLLEVCDDLYDLDNIIFNFSKIRHMNNRIHRDPIVEECHAQNIRHYYPGCRLYFTEIGKERLDESLQRKYKRPLCLFSRMHIEKTKDVREEEVVFGKQWVKRKMKGKREMRVIQTYNLNSAITYYSKKTVLHSEREYKYSIERATDFVVKTIAKKPIVLLSGPSGSGKTTTANRIADSLKSKGLNAIVISMDDYFLPLNGLDEEEKQKLDLESPERLDIPLLLDHLQKFIDCVPVEIPKFNFADQTRESGGIISRENDDIIIMEGIHALNPIITKAIYDHRTCIYVSVRTRIASEERILHPSMIRLMRRIMRDMRFRGRSIEETILSYPSVQAGEDKYIMPFKKSVMHDIDTFMPFEMPVYASELIDRLETIDKSFPLFSLVDEMLFFLKQIRPLSREMVPDDSIIKEFIG